MLDDEVDGTCMALCAAEPTASLRGSIEVSSLSVHILNTSRVGRNTGWEMSTCHWTEDG